MNLNPFSKNDDDTVPAEADTVTNHTPLPEHMKKEAHKPRKKVEKVEEKDTVPGYTGPTVTYLGPGGLSGEYRFAEFAGSIAARSPEEAMEKARELAIKHPNLLIK